MNREEWISYYESINGHKPSGLEIAKAEKDGEILMTAIPLIMRIPIHIKTLVEKKSFQ